MLPYFSHLQTHDTYHRSNWRICRTNQDVNPLTREDKREVANEGLLHSTLIGVGFSSKTASLNRAPGWEPESWGYHGDDGHCFQAQNVGKHYGPTFGYGDVIGCGVNFRTGTAFFTKNGHYLGMFDEKRAAATSWFAPVILARAVLTLVCFIQESRLGKSRGSCTPVLGSKRPESMFVSTSARHRSCSTLIPS